MHLEWRKLVYEHLTSYYVWLSYMLFTFRLSCDTSPYYTQMKNEDSKQVNDLQSHLGVDI